MKGGTQVEVFTKYDASELAEMFAYDLTPFIFTTYDDRMIIEFDHYKVKCGTKSFIVDKIEEGECKVLSGHKDYIHPEKLIGQSERMSKEYAENFGDYESGNLA